MRRNLLGGLALSTTLLMGATSATAGTWETPTTISSYYIYSTGSAFITVADMPNPNSCANPGHLLLDPNAVNFKYIWAQVIAAQTTGQPVTLEYSDNCVDGYMLVEAVAIPEHD